MKVSSNARKDYSTFTKHLRSDEVTKTASENKLAAGHNPEDVTKAFHKEMENDFGTVGGLRESLLLALRKPTNS